MGAMVIAVFALTYACARAEQGHPIDWLGPYITIVAWMQDTTEWAAEELSRQRWDASGSKQTT